MKRATQLKQGRTRARLTQVQAAKRLGLSQPYLSLLEKGKRSLTERVARKMANLYGLPPTVLPTVLRKRGSRVPDPERLVRELAALGYPGYAHVGSPEMTNPATLLLNVLSAEEVPPRITQALPWVVAKYPDLDWRNLVSEAKLRDIQNRLGFVVALARELAARDATGNAVEHLERVGSELEESRLVAETTLARESMPESERAWLRENRPPAAQHWNVLTSLTSDEVAAASAA